MRRALTAALLLLAALAPVAPSAAATSAEIVLTGSRAAWAEVSFPGRFKPAIGLFGRDELRVTTRGTYAGVYFESVTKPGRLSQGGVVLTAVDDFPVAWGGSDRDDFTLPAGRYRVHLLTDGQSTVRVAVDGLPRGLRLAPRGPSDARAKVADVTAARASIPVTVRPATTTVLVGFAHSEPSVATAASVCLDEGRDVPCEAGGGYGFKTAMLAPGAWSSTATAIFVYPGQASNGEHAAHYTMASPAPTSKLYGFALSIH
ncbi:MAG TPA: hypothetical protein VF519_10055 [Mycobacteriales bacterium]|jgi:hypothetical protein